MDFMTSEALVQLWEVQQRALRHEKEFWRLADDFLGQGLVALEDIATIYGCHPHTARRRCASSNHTGDTNQPDLGGTYSGRDPAQLAIDRAAAGI
jgi:hypothetical protein